MFCWGFCPEDLAKKSWGIRWINSDRAAAKPSSKYLAGTWIYFDHHWTWKSSIEGIATWQLGSPLPALPGRYQCCINFRQSPSITLRVLQGLQAMEKVFDIQDQKCSFDMQNLRFAEEPDETQPGFLEACTSMRPAFATLSWNVEIKAKLLERERKISYNTWLPHHHHWWIWPLQTHTAAMGSRPPA